MKKKFFFICVILSITLHAQNPTVGSVPDGTDYANYQEQGLASRILWAGTEFPELNGFSETAFQVFDFPANSFNSTSMIRMGLNDRNYKNRFLFFANTSGQSTFVLHDKNGSEFLKINEGSLGENKMFMHLIKPDSRIVIGSHGLYLPEHKFVVKSGSAMIEGNILTNNNIGIGTSNFDDGGTTYRLSVNGRIRAHGVKVYTTWADYVFKDNYRLKPLKEVKEYIQKNGHLPNIPSEAEVLKNGIELGEMNAKLLEKIEELTLYVIELKEEIDTLKKKNNEN